MEQAASNLCIALEADGVLEGTKLTSSGLGRTSSQPELLQSHGLTALGRWNHPSSRRCASRAWLSSASVPKRRPVLAGPGDVWTGCTLDKCPAEAKGHLL